MSDIFLLMYILHMYILIQLSFYKNIIMNRILNLTQIIDCLKFLSSLTRFILVFAADIKGERPILT